MLIKANQREEKGGEFFNCKYCDYFTSKKINFTRHLSTDKHKNKENANKMLTNGIGKWFWLVGLT